MRFSTQMCPDDEPPAAKRLKILPTENEESTPVSASTSDEMCSLSPPPLYEETAGHSSKDGNPAPAFFDLDTLDCNVCMEPLSAPIFQCCNGHYSCLGCTVKMSNKCPACSEPTGKIRNLGLEKIIESLRLKCRFFRYGCKNSMTYGVKKIHEQTCLFAPFECPIASCPFFGPLKALSLHFKDFHNAQVIQFNYDTWFTVPLSLDDNYVVLQAEDRSFLFRVLEENLGKVIYVSSFCCPNLEQSSCTYRLEVKTGKRHLTLASTIQNLHHCFADLKSIDFLLIPRRFYASEEVFQVEVTISGPTGSEFGCRSDMHAL